MLGNSGSEWLFRSPPYRTGDDAVDPPATQAPSPVPESTELASENTSPDATTTEADLNG